ncbi:arsenic resistance N-acetyltransferase ArsN2 [uncultured Thiothrix sp.]|uniref:arsenic resistance N-acetyltransferase ArsN2 n=1 Tax=uncultured Thiothrix sp. TaxID=223185 RepID=UPI002634DE11|nr:arsenic resistance N-acetyltransferase ArsN2 [uncultured Thiothrix sp.]
MQIPDIHARLIFLREAERLKDVLRTAHTRTGKQESTAEHTWRLGLFILSFADQLPDLDLLKVLKMALLHDLGEAIHGDIPAINQQGRDKLEQERADLVTLMHTLPTKLQVEFLSLWDEYNQAQTLEAQAVKAFDKLETILQHNQGANPPAFDYAFNLTYGQRYTQINPLFAAIRALLDAETRQLALQQVPAMNIEFLAVDDELENLLDLCQLPSDDIYAAHVQFFGIRRANRLVAVVGLESYESVGLLRSLAVLPDYRSLGIAQRLVSFIEEQAVEQGLKQLYLLTMTARNFFQALNYRLIERALAPLEIQTTAQFNGLCPATAVLLVKDLGAE